MALRDEIRTLQDRIVLQLEDVYHFDAHTLWAYQEIKELRQSNPGGSVTTAIGSKHSTEEILSFLDHYKNEYLHALAFQHTVALFEAFIFDFARLILINQPRLLSGSKKIDVEVIIKYHDYKSLILFLADKELNELKYAKVADWFSYIDKLMHLGCPTEDEIERFAEIKASRDILVHNSARVNSIYLMKAGNQVRYSEGEKLDIPFRYFRLSWLLIKKMINDISESAQKRLAKEPKAV